jgi:methylated-DNA-protein-cysteine methyltransferase related protein
MMAPNWIPVPPDPERFNPLVWEIARQIPPGKVYSYGQIAELIPPSPGITPQDYAAFRSRWAGSAMSHCPEGVPWHRVINAQGKISFSNPGMHARQRELLEAEGVIFDTRERVDLARFGWTGPSRDWLQSRDLLPPDQKYQQTGLL